MIDSFAGVSFDALTNYALAVLVPAILLIIGWAAWLQKSVTDLRIMIAESYVRSEALEPILEDLEWMKRTLIRIATKMGVETDRQ